MTIEFRRSKGRAEGRGRNRRGKAHRRQRGGGDRVSRGTVNPQGAEIKIGRDKRKGGAEMRGEEGEVGKESGTIGTALGARANLCQAVRRVKRPGPTQIRHLPTKVRVAAEDHRGQGKGGLEPSTVRRKRKRWWLR